jgi:hypothetical protein
VNDCFRGTTRIGTCPSRSKEIEIEIAHVWFIDTVGYSRLLIDDQRDLSDPLKPIVRGTHEFRSADAAGKLIKVAIGDGMVLSADGRP